MAIRIYPYLSPRIIEVLAPDTEISLQDLHNALRDWEDGGDGITFPFLIDSAGKEALGGGVTVGITSTLQDAYVMFTGRTTPLETGICSEDDSDGTTLEAAYGQFVTNGVAVGDTVMNHTTQALANVINVVSETELQTLQLSGGSRATWLTSDEYIIWNNQQCNISGGNLVAVDDVGSEMSPVLPSPNTQVVRTASSSATLQELDAIQYATYQEAVWLDPNSSNEGVDYPMGNREYPVNNLTDAVAIANNKGFDTLQILASVTLNSGTVLTGFTIVGKSHVLTEVTMSSGAQCENVTIRNCNISGVLDGGTNIENCLVGTLTYVNGHIHNSELYGTVILDGNEDAAISNSGIVDPNSPPIIDMNGSGQDLVMNGWVGNVTIKNLTGSSEIVMVQLNGGILTLDTTITAGNFEVTGVGILDDQSTSWTTLDTDGLMSKETISAATLDTALAGFTNPNTVASSLIRAAYSNEVHLDVTNGSAGNVYPRGLPSSPVDNITDAKTIQDTYNLDKIHVIGDLTVTSGDNVDDRIIKGSGATFTSANTTITLDSGCSTSGTQWEDLRVEGVQGGESYYVNCIIGSVSNTHCRYDGCGLVGPNQLNNGGWTVNHATDLIECRTTKDWYVVDYNGSALTQVYTRFAGRIKITNFTHASGEIFLEMDAGEVWIDSSCTDGTITIAGVGTLQNDSSIVPDTDGLMSKDTISATVWERTEELRYRIETLRGEKHGFGTTYYWDPYGGDDANDGLSVDNAVATFAQAHTLAPDHSGAVIVALSKTPAADTIVTERIDVSKDDIFLIGPGDSFKFQPTTDGNVITVSGTDCLVSGFYVSNLNASSGHGVCVTGHNVSLQQIKARYNKGDGFCMDGAKFTKITNCRAAHNEGHGVCFMGNSKHSKVEATGIDENDTNGIDVAASVYDLNLYGVTSIHDNLGIGINAANGSTNIHLHTDVFVDDNAGGNIVDPGGAVETVWQRQAEATWAEVKSGVVAIETTAVSGSTATAIKTGLTQADDFFNNMQVVITGSAGTVARNITDFQNTDGVIVVDELPFTPQAGDEAIILSRTSGGGGTGGSINPQQVAEAVWDALSADHEITDTMGAIMALLSRGALNLPRILPGNGA